LKEKEPLHVMEVDTRWHLDKKVPIALIGAILIQTGTFIWFMAHLDARVGILEQRAADRSLLPDRVTRLEVIVEQIPDTLKEIKSMIRDYISTGKK
jgi:hypothetical protein